MDLYYKRNMKNKKYKMIPYGFENSKWKENNPENLEYKPLSTKDKEDKKRIYRNPRKVERRKNKLLLSKFY